MRSSSALAAPPTPTVLATPTAVATPTAPDRLPEEQTAASRRFAELLREHRGERSAPSARAASPTEASVPARSEARDGADTTATESSAPPNAPATASQAKARASGAKGATAKATAEHAPVAEARAHDGAADDGDTAATAPTATDERAASFAALAAANAAPGPADPAPARAGAPAKAETTRADAANDDASGEASGGAVHRRAPTVVDAESTPPERESASVASLPASRDAPFQAALGDVGRVARVATDTGPASNHADAAAASIAAAGPVRGSSEAAGTVPTALTLATPIDAPEFSATFGIQVSLLAQDGVQHAELHLNPAETGPVSIHIAVEGTTARVDFGADLAATRQAIERGLPELAGALRDAGLTLTGGGVSQHAGSRQGGDRGAPGPRTANAAAPIAAPPRTVTRIAAGGIDLYA